MPHDPALDPISILAALGIGDVTALEPLQGGMDTSMWRVEQGAATYALRVLRAEQIDTYQRELAAMQAARQANLPVPMLQATGLWHDRPALLLSWCPGSTLLDALRRRPWLGGRLGVAFGQAQARIHQVSAPARLAEQPGQWIAWAGPEAQQLHMRLQHVAGSATALMHLDYHPLNVLTDGTQITAILDWANARAGDPRADVARTYSILVIEPHGRGRQSLLLSVLRRLLERSWRRGYEQVAGRLPDLALFYAWAGAVMMRDLAPHMANPQSWWQPGDLEHIRAWTLRWKQHAERTI